MEEPSDYLHRMHQMSNYEITSLAADESMNSDINDVIKAVVADYTNDRESRTRLLETLKALKKCCINFGEFRQIRKELFGEK